MQLEEANLAPGIEEAVALEATIGLNVEGELGHLLRPFENFAGPLFGVDVGREGLGESGPVGLLFFGGQLLLFGALFGLFNVFCRGYVIFVSFVSELFRGMPVFRGGRRGLFPPARVLTVSAPREATAVLC